jgi:hypothetical protein
MALFQFFRTNDDATCLIWSKGESKFWPLNPWATRLPESYGGQKFDFHQAFEDTVYFRPWGLKQFWKGRIDQVYFSLSFVKKS